MGAAGDRHRLALRSDGFARRAANRVVFMADGEIQEEADPETFFTAPTSARAKDFLSKILTH